MSDLLLIHPALVPDFMAGGRSTYSPAPMGLFSLAQFLADRGVPVRVSHLGVERLADPGFRVSRLLDEERPRIVGVSLHWHKTAARALELAREIKAHSPRAFVVLGGLTSGLYAAEIIRDHPAVDAVVRGDGEEPLLRLARALDPRDPRALAAIPNLVWRRGARAVVNAAAYAAAGAELSAVEPRPEALLRHFAAYRDRCAFWTRSADGFARMYVLEVGRGCPYECLFCGGSASARRAATGRAGLAHRSPAACAGLIEEAAREGFETVYVCWDPFRDDSFYVELFGLVARRGLGLSLAFGSWRLPSPRLMAAAGRAFAEVFYEVSPECFRESLRRRVKDPRLFYGNAELEAWLRRLGAFPKQKAQVYLSYMLPGETLDDVYDTFDYALRLREEHGERVEVCLCPVTTDPGAIMNRAPRRHGIVSPPSSLRDYAARVEAAESRGELGDLVLHRTKAVDDAAFAALGRQAALVRALPARYSRAIRRLHGDAKRFIRGFAPASGWRNDAELRARVDRYVRDSLRSARLSG